MILVLSGTISKPFYRLFESVVEVATSRKEEIIIQGSFPPPTNSLPITIVESIPHKKLLELLKKARRVISAGGEGSVIDLLFFSPGKPILFPRMAAHGEHVDDQQEKIALALSQKKVVEYASTSSDLKKLLSKKTPKNASFLKGNTSLPVNEELVAFLSKLSHYL